MRILITGHRGYIGSVLVDMLLQQGHAVVGLDTDLYRGSDFGHTRDHTRESTPSLDTDIRDVELDDLVGFEAVIHLAALPAGVETHVGAAILREVNHDATVRLARVAAEAGVARFLFASSSAVYGRNARAPVDENAPVRPLTAWAKAKLAGERDLADMASESFAPVAMRIAEVYGESPRLHLDAVVNDLVGSAVTHGRVSIRSGAAGWRSVVHVEDVCRAMTALLTARDEKVSGEAFNIAAEDEDYRIIDIADAISEMLPLCTRSPAIDAYDDHSLRVSATKLRAVCPELSFRWTLLPGIRQLMAAMSENAMTPGDWRSARFRRAMHLANLLESVDLGEGSRMRQSSLL